MFSGQPLAIAPRLARQCLGAHNLRKWSVGMNIIILFITMIFTNTCCPGANASQETKVNYEPEVVKLIGTVEKQTFPGPPNYESTSNGDRPETSWILHLKSPIEVVADKTSELNSQDERNVAELQLVFLDDAGESRKLLKKGATILATGTLFHSHTGHHHTHILLTVRELSQPVK
jgi:hypothetical protein